MSLIVALLNGRRADQPELAAVPPRPAQSPAKRLLQGRGPVPPAGDLVEYRGQRVPASAFPKLETAEKCKAKADEIANSYQAPHPARDLLTGLARKLLKEDTGYAVADRQKILDHFDWLSERPPYTNIAAIVASYDSDPTSSGLFLDASLYVGLRCEIDEWQRKEVAEGERQLGYLQQSIERANEEGASLGAMKRAEFMKKSTPSWLDVAAKRIKDLEETKEAYRELFTFRLKERYGLSGALLEKLDPLVLTNVGPPDLQVPY